MENKGVNIQKLLAYCDAAKRVYDYYDSSLILYSGSDSDVQEVIEKRNKAFDRYVGLILKLDKLISEYFDED